MALSATTIWECQTTGSDTLNGGAFDPGQTAGMFTDGAATSATGASPVFSSASYNFVAGDVGAWVYIASGTNWIAGWYKIASVAANTATLNATLGQGVKAVANSPTVPTITTGCATTASPTGATWSIDYSQQAAAQFTYTDLASVGAGLLVSSVAFPFAKQQVGNSIVITGGTNFTAGRYVIASVAAGVATVVGAANITTGAGVSGTGGQGGALASPGQVGGFKVSQNQTFIKVGTYIITSATPNISGGCISDATSSTTGGVHLWEGYQTVRGDLDTAPLLQASGISTFTMMALAGGSAGVLVRNIILDGASLTASTGLSSSRRFVFQKMTVKNCTANGYSITSNSDFLQCTATGCGGTTGTHYGFNTTSGCSFVACEAYSNTVGGFLSNNSGRFINCLSYSNSGASSDGFNYASQVVLVGCVAYSNGRDGFRNNAAEDALLINCIAESNVGFGTGRAAPIVTTQLTYNFGTFGNGTAIDTASFPFVSGNVAGSASFFVNAAAGNFALNNTAGAGAALRAAGYPGVYPAGTTTGFADIGGAQHADPASGPVGVIGS